MPRAMSTSPPIVVRAMSEPVKAKPLEGPVVAALELGEVAAPLEVGDTPEEEDTPEDGEDGVTTAVVQVPGPTVSTNVKVKGAPSGAVPTLVKTLLPQLALTQGSPLILICTCPPTTRALMIRFKQPVGPTVKVA